MLAKIRRRVKDMKALTELMTTAERFARADGVELPGSEHVVAAAIDHSDGRAAALAGSHGVDAEGFLVEVRRVHADALDEIGIDEREEAIDPALPEGDEPVGLYRATPSAQQLLKCVAETSDGFDSAEFLRQASRTRRGTAAAALRRLGITDHGSGE
jgi:hypothetical protein